MRNLCAFVVLLFLLCTQGMAGDLTVTGQHGLLWDPSIGASPVHVFGIENTTGTSDTLLSWQLSVRVVGTTSSTGNVRFDSASLPDDYLLAGRSTGLVPAFSGPSGEIPAISDTDGDFLGVTVPANGANLLQVDFVASPDAAGWFNIELLPFDADSASYWFSVDTFAPTSFLNAPSGGDPVAIGSLWVGSVPEPTAAVLGGLGVIVGLLFWHRDINGQRDKRGTSCATARKSN